MKKLANIQTILLLFILINTKSSVSVGICRENEQQALETLKKEAIDPDNVLSDWVVGKDCCQWKIMVVCNNLTRHVTELYIYTVDERSLTINSLTWLPQLSNLKILYIDSVDLSKAANWVTVINMLPFLLDITLNNCSLQNIPPLLHHNFSSLKSIDFSWNNFNSPLPNWVFNITSLVSLNIKSSGIRGVLPSNHGDLNKLTDLDLSHNNLNSTIPNWLNRCKFKNLKHLLLSHNKLTGNLPKFLGQRFPKLVRVHISHNMLEGVVTENHFSNLTQLRSFDAFNNNLTLKVSQNWIPPFNATFINMGGWNLGPLFPMWLRTQEDVGFVDISNGGIEGEVPTWFWNLVSQMRFLNLSYNRLVGEVALNKQNWHKMDIGPNIFPILSLGSNNFSGPLPNISTHVSQIDLSNNYFSGGLSPLFCVAAKNESYALKILNLGKCYLSGEIPDCWMNWPMLEVIVLKNNNLVGEIPRSMELLSQLKSLDLSGNSLAGPFPLFLEKCTSLLKLDLAENAFVGELPPWLGMRLSYLIILSLRSNKFHGELPTELCHLKDLQILDLANNKFFGNIPICIDNFTAMITGKKLDDPTLSYSSSYLVGSTRESATVSTKGNTYYYDTILLLVTSMDMSNNNLSGDIPLSLTNLIGLRFCNISINHLSGNIPNGIDHMKVLESIDLSKNQLSGHIPQSLSSLSTLSFLNLSFNNLSGMIPLSTQLQSFSHSSFQGNRLCGLPLLVNCSSGGQLPNKDNVKDENDGLDEVDWFYVSMAVGFVMSFWGISALLIFKRSWRHAYYRFIDSSYQLLCAKLQI